MVQRVRCPVCGLLAWSSQLQNSYDFEVFDAVSLGKAHGFKYVVSSDMTLLELVKRKIKTLYERFCVGVSTLPSVVVSVVPTVGTWLIPSGVSEVSPPSEIQTYPKLR